MFANWESIRNDYDAWHVDHIPMPTLDEKTHEDKDTHIKIQQNMEIYE
jgi:hypothetical protein